MINIDKYDFFIFDCDGVILDSNKLKTSAFSSALPDEPLNLIEEFITYHKKYGGVSRYEKFKYYFEKIKNENKAEMKIEKAVENFAAIVSKELLKCNYVSGVIDFIDILFNQKKFLFVVSGSDENELIQVFNKRGIDYYFKNIYGSPINKIENTKKVISKMNKVKKGIFFGDSKSDYDASRKFGLDFVFVKDHSEWKDGYKRNLSEDNLVINNFINIKL